MSDAVALAAIVILLFPMGYFFLASPAFLLVKLDIPEVARLLRGMFNAHFLMLSIAGVIGTIAFVVTGHLAFAIVTGLIAAFAVWARRWFLQEWDAQLDARDAGDAGAVRRLRRLHWGGMLCNAIQLAVIVGSIPYVDTNATSQPSKAKAAKAARHPTMPKSAASAGMIASCPAVVPAVAMPIASPGRVAPLRATKLPATGRDARPKPAPPATAYPIKSCQYEDIMLMLANATVSATPPAVSIRRAPCRSA